MLTFGIILAVLAIILCFSAACVSASNGHFGLSLFMAFLVGLNVYILVDDIKILNNPQHEVETHVVKNIKEYYVDSTTVINGADTTKTYTITYIK